MTAHDLPEGLIIQGNSTEDVADIMSQFRIRVALEGDVDAPKSEVDRRVIRYLPLLLKDSANVTYNQLA